MNWTMIAGIVLCVMNLIGFFVCGADKWFAKKQKWRVKEKTLFLLTWLGGGFGMWIAMYVFRHKTKHWYFVFGIPLITLAEYSLLVYFWTSKIIK